MWKLKDTWKTTDSEVQEEPISAELSSNSSTQPQSHHSPVPGLQSLQRHWASRDSSTEVMGHQSVQCEWFTPRGKQKADSTGFEIKKGKKKKKRQIWSTGLKPTAACRLLAPFSWVKTAWFPAAGRVKEHSGTNYIIALNLEVIRQTDIQLSQEMTLKLSEMFH